MTNTLATLTGTCVAIAEAATASSALDAVPTLSGTAILVWLVLRLNKTNEDLLTRNREIADRCSNCTLAQAANRILIEHAKHPHDTDADNSGNPT